MMQGKGPSLALMEESLGFSPVASGSLGCHSSCGRGLRKRILLPQGSEVSFRVARGNAGLHGVTAGERGLILH